MSKQGPQLHSLAVLRFVDQSRQVAAGSLEGHGDRHARRPSGAGMHRASVSGRMPTRLPRPLPCCSSSATAMRRNAGVGTDGPRRMLAMLDAIVALEPSPSSLAQDGIKPQRISQGGGFP